MKLFVYKTVKCEVINVEFHSKNLPRNNTAIMVKWKCLKFWYLSKGMCRIDSQFVSCLKYLILETPYTFSPYSVGILVLLCFQVLTTTTFPFFVFVFTTLKKKVFICQIFLALIWYRSKWKHLNITERFLWLPNQFRKHCRFKQQPLRWEIFNISEKRGETYMGGLGILWGAWQLLRKPCYIILSL